MIELLKKIQKAFDTQLVYQAGGSLAPHHVHDEGQMEVDADQVEVYQYNIPAASWKEEEKKEYYDELGRMWSAPAQLEAFDDQLACVRYYHPIGEQYCIALRTAGEFLKLRCPTAGEYKIGYNWHDTH